MSKQINIGVIGLGAVGTSLVNLFEKNKTIFENNYGYQFKVIKALVKNKNKKRALPYQPEYVDSLANICQDKNIDVVVELSGDINIALAALKDSLNAGKAFVTANKAMLAEKGSEIWPYFNKFSSKIGFEASVGGSLPIIRTLQESYNADNITHIAAIINGTTNYILSAMSEKSLDFESALKKAKELGFAEADPSLDLKGIDSAHKITILASIAYNKYFEFKDVYCEGIEKITKTDIEHAKSLGYTIKLLAMASKIDGNFSLKVQPTMIKKSSILAPVSDGNNAFFIRGDYIGDALIYGQGAGGNATSVAVAADIIEVSKAITANDHNGHVNRYNFNKSKVLNFSKLECEHYLRFSVLDRVGVLNSVSKAFSTHNVSIHQLMQHDSAENKKGVDLIIITHLAENGAIENILQDLSKQDFTLDKPVQIRIDDTI